MADANSVILPLKVILILSQFFLVILIGYSREEFIYRSLKQVRAFESDEYRLASIHMWISAGLFAFFLLAEFCTLIFGISVLFKQLNVVQVLVHFSGVLALLWMILESWRYDVFDYIAVLTGVLPFMLELCQIFIARYKFDVIVQIQKEQRLEARRQREIFERRERKA